MWGILEADARVKSKSVRSLKESLPCIIVRASIITVVVGSVAVIEVLLCVVVVTLVFLIFGEVVILLCFDAVLAFLVGIVGIIIGVLVSTGVGISALVELSELVEATLLEESEVLLGASSILAVLFAVADDVPELAWEEVLVCNEVRY